MAADEGDEPRHLPPFDVSGQHLLHARAAFSTGLSWLPSASAMKGSLDGEKVDGYRQFCPHKNIKFCIYKQGQ